MLRPHARPTVSGYESESGCSELLPLGIETSHFDLDQSVICDVTCSYNSMPDRCRWITQVTLPMHRLCPSGPSVVVATVHGTPISQHIEAVGLPVKIVGAGWSPAPTK